MIAFDEPTSSLSNVETDKLFEVIRDLKSRGVGIIYVSHRLEEIMLIADHVTVLRDGRNAGDAPVTELDQNKIVRMMIGEKGLEAEESAEAGMTAAASASTLSPEVLRVTNLSTKKIKDVSFTLRKGELLGISGLVGSGRTETVRAIFGADPAQGDIFIHGKKASIHSTYDAIAAGMGFLPEDRKGQGLLRLLPVKINIALAGLNKMEHLGLINYHEMDRLAADYVTSLKIQPPYPDRLVMNLSGGNQQKVVLARWLLTKSEIVIFDEPTRGVDVGAKAEIYHLMEQLISQGKSIIMVSSELPEILRMSHRILVMREGRVVKELPRSAATKEVIMYHATGGK